MGEAIFRCQPTHPGWGSRVCGGGSVAVSQKQWAFRLGDEDQSLK